MKTLVLMRHGHAEDDLDDHGRRLTRKGRGAAERAALELREVGFAPALVLSSSAARALQTADVVVDVLGLDRSIVESRNELYLAEPSGYHMALRALEETLDAILVVGHNPGLSRVARSFGHPGALPPAGYCLTRDVVSWAGLRA